MTKEEWKAIKEARWKYKKGFVFGVGAKGLLIKRRGELNSIPRRSQKKKRLIKRRG